MNLQKELLKTIPSEGICQEGRRLIQEAKATEAGISTLLDFFFEQLYYCLENDYPRLEVFRQYIHLTQRNNLILDRFSSLTPRERETVLLGNARAEYEVKAYEVKQFYLQHHAELELKVSGKAYVEVYLYADARLRLTAEDEAKVIIHSHSPNTKIDIVRSSGKAVVDVSKK